MRSGAERVIEENVPATTPTSITSKVSRRLGAEEDEREERKRHGNGGVE